MNIILSSQPLFETCCDQCASPSDTTLILLNGCVFKDITQTSPDYPAILNTETYTSITMSECVFESVVSQKTEGEIMILHTATLEMKNTSFAAVSPSTLSSDLPPSHPASQKNEEDIEKRAMNTECDGDCSCSWHHSALLLQNVSATSEQCSFRNMNQGALSAENESLLTLVDSSFELEAVDLPG